MNLRRWLRPCLGGLLLLLLLWLFGGQARAESVRYDPASRIQRPHGQGVAYVTAAAAVGALADGSGLDPGYSLSVIFRPHRAADFYPALYAWNTAMVLQVDRQGDAAASIVSGDLLFRRYLGDMRSQLGGRAVFVGAGAGISRAAWARRGAVPGGSANAFSFLAEAGLEWNPQPALVLVGKGQYRLYDRDGRNHSGWSVHVGAGLPLPF